MEKNIFQPTKTSWIDPFMLFLDPVQSHGRKSRDIDIKVGGEWVCRNPISSSHFEDWEILFIMRLFL